ncbi:hypothetical protein KAR91_02890 [Candidatus Pacearchaeota archaeon]|nr:hypothetical protein [Candidatus Pacearchaeota archaeon]
MAEIFKAEASDEGVKVEEGAKFSPENGDKYDPRESVQGRWSDESYMETSLKRLNDTINEMNKKLNEATGGGFDMSSTDSEEAKLLTQVVQKKLNDVGANFMQELGKLDTPDSALDKGWADAKKSELISNLITKPLDTFINGELDPETYDRSESEADQLIAAVEESEGSRDEFAMSMMTPEERKKADIDHRAASASDTLSSLFGTENAYTSNAHEADKAED